MRLTNTKETYGLIHQVLHWATAILIIAMFALGKFMHELPLANSEDVAIKAWWYSLHKTVGILTLIVIICRVTWAMIQPHPSPLKGGLEAFAAKLVHWVLYGLMILLPITGWFHHAAAQGFAPIWWPFSQDLPFIAKDADISLLFNIAHHMFGFALIIALFLHIAGAIKHAVVDKDQVVARMVPGRYFETGASPAETGNNTLPFLAALILLGFVSAVISGIFYVEKTSRDTTENSLENISQPAKAGAWKVDMKKSELAFEITQLGSPVKGTFKDWAADVIFDPGNLQEAVIEATVTIGSFHLPDVADQALSADFLNAAVNPTASFKSTKVSKSGGKFEAIGVLKLAGIEQPFALPFTFEETDGRAIVTAETEIQRLDFGVGTAYADDSSVGRKVRLLITIEAEK